MSPRRRNMASMIRTSIIAPQEAALIAVSALDDLVTELLKTSPFKLSARFLDWVADEATPLVEDRVHSAFSNPAFAATLRKGDHRIALSRWVRHWVCPRIASRFVQLAEHLPKDVMAPADLTPVHAVVVPARVMQPSRPVRISPHPVAAAVQAAF